MNRNTQRIIAGLLVFLMVATLLVGILASASDGGGSERQPRPPAGEPN